VNGVSGSQIFLLTIYFVLATVALGLIGWHIVQVLDQVNVNLTHICQATPHCEGSA
jgi:hypothetical protein